MKTIFKVISVTDCIDVNFDPPMRFVVRLESSAGVKLSLHGLTDEQVLPYAALDNAGNLRRDFASKLFPADGEFTVEPVAVAEPVPVEQPS